MLRNQISSPLGQLLLSSSLIVCFKLYCTLFHYSSSALVFEKDGSCDQLLRAMYVPEMNIPKKCSTDNKNNIYNLCYQSHVYYRDCTY